MKAVGKKKSGLGDVGKLRRRQTKRDVGAEAAGTYGSRIWLGCESGRDVGSCAGGR